MPAKKKEKNKPIKTTTFLHKDKPLGQHINEVAAKDRKSVISNPAINPAGKLQVRQSASQKVFPGNGGYYRYVEVKTDAAPDPAHAARLRGAAARKARGTQSSTTRRTIK
jgi:hypothetical protein